MILGLIYPKSGELTTDGIPIENIKKGSWHKILSWMGQDPYLFYGTIERISHGVKRTYRGKSLTMRADWRAAMTLSIKRIFI